MVYIHHILVNGPYQVGDFISHCPLPNMVCIWSSPKHTTYHLYHHRQPIALVASCMGVGQMYAYVCVRESNTAATNDLPVSSLPPRGISPPPFSVALGSVVSCR